MGNGAASPLQPHLSPKAKAREVRRLCTRSLLEAQVLFRHLEIETLKCFYLDPPDKLVINLVSG